MIETILAASRMDEILYELRALSGTQTAALGLHLLVHQEVQGRQKLVLADRARVTIRRRLCARMRCCCWLRAKAKRSCDRRDERLIPIKNDPAKNELRWPACAAIAAPDATDGYDGGWVAHSGAGVDRDGGICNVLGDVPIRLTRSGMTSQGETRPIC